MVVDNPGLCPPRVAKEMVPKGIQNLRKIITSKDPDATTDGIKGLPIIHSLENFDEVTGHVADHLHVVFHGIVKNMLTPLVRKVGSDISLRGKGEEKFHYSDRLQKSVKIPSEINHAPPSFEDFATKWKALDFMVFLLHEVTLLLSDPEIIEDQRVYPVFLHLSNAIYLLHHGRQDEAKLDEAELEIGKFARRYMEVYGEEYATSLFHKFQHSVMTARTHGPAFLWDAFKSKCNFFGN